MNVAEREALLQSLMRGNVCTVAELAQAADLETDSVDIAMMALRDLGLEVEEIAGAGYRLREPLELLNAREIQSRLNAGVARCVESVEVESVLTSSSDYLAALPTPAPGLARVCLAEYQTRGRGRLRRRWLAPFGSGICLSLDWSFEERPHRLGALSLAVGASLADALGAFGVVGLALKWPNDILCSGDKLGGILIDGQGTGAGPCRVIVGVGINHRLPPAARAEILDLGNRATDLAGVCPDDLPGRNDVAAAITNAVVGLLNTFAVDGFEPWAGKWRELDSLRGRPVCVTVNERPVEGIAQGIDPGGALLVKTATGVERVIAGEVRESHACASTD